MKVNYNSAMQKFVAGLLAQLPLPLSDAYVHSTATDPLQKFMFSVKFVPVDPDDTTFPEENTAIGFQKVSGLDWDLNVVEYHEGCTNYAIKLAGKAKFGEVTMEKGAIPYNNGEGTNLGNTTNILDFLQASAGDTTFRMDIVIQLLGRDGAIRAEYTLHDAFISKWEGPEGDATSDDVAVEKITVQYDYPTYTATPSGTGRGTRWDAQDGPVEFGTTTTSE